MLGAHAGETFEDLRHRITDTPSLTVFPDGGFAVLRADGMHVLMDSGPVGLRGRGGHGHNDACAVEIWASGAPLVVDPGCYQYTADVAARQSFRSTRAHNTPQFAEHEINEVLGLWQLADDAKARIVDAQTTPEGAVVRGAHVGYLRFDPRASVEREVMVSRDGCRIVDEVGVDGHWSVRWTLAPSVDVVTVSNEEIHLRRGGVEFIMTIEGAASVVVTAAWVAPSFGVKVPTKAIDVNFPGSECVVSFCVA